ncbi:hypothetical protein [Glaciihabitans sp. UYNi722]|uniref:hypothetical protein n=1 Tax=Glaciihabitans sp. UYNi722 TaxID=3156344 RepID=UPI003393A45F
MTDVQATAAQPEQALIVIGDITVSKSWLVTPNGSRPLKGTQIFITDLSHTQTKIPTWAIVLAIIGAFFFLLGLLFLLAKETVTTGHLQVTVQNGNLIHVTQVPVTSPGAVQDAHSRVNYVRALVAATGA